MIKKLLLFITLFLIYLPTSIYADNNVSNLAKNWFENYSNKATKRLDSDGKINFYNLFSDRVNQLIQKKDFTKEQLILLNDLIKLANEYSFETYINKIEKDNKKVLNSYEVLNDFKYFAYNKDKIFLENGVWYSYSHENELIFPEGATITKKDLDFNKIYPNSTVVFLRNDKRIGFIVNYKKVKLISDSIIYGIPNKYNFLKEIKNDKKTLNYETDSLFQNIKNITQELTIGKSEKEKIKILYNYILDNIEYPKSYSLSDSKLFSGIDTFKNKSGICEGYVKLFMYMLNFANINYTEVKRGYVIDAFDFPQVGHAWLKIGNYYYDITFDDPIGINKTKEFKEYLYYKLPKDLIYTNRYDVGELPEYIKTLSEEDRKKIIVKNISGLLDKYKNSNYNLLKPYYLKQENGISLNKKLDINDLIKIMGYYEVENFVINMDGKDKTIINLGYYDLDDNIIEDILIQLNYNLDGHYLLKWKLDNGKYIYRLGYDLNLK